MFNLSVLLSIGRLRVVAPKDESIGSIVRIVKGQVEQGGDVVVNINNHYEGCAVLTVERLVRELGEI